MTSAINALSTYYVLDIVLTFYQLSFQWSIINDYSSHLHFVNVRNEVSKNLNTKPQTTLLVFAKPADAPFFMSPDHDKLHAFVWFLPQMISFLLLSTCGIYSFFKIDIDSRHLTQLVFFLLP